MYVCAKAGPHTRLPPSVSGGVEAATTGEGFRFSKCVGEEIYIRKYS